MNDGVITARIHRNGWIARSHGELGQEFLWKELLEVIEGPVNRHRPFIASVIEFCFLFEDCVVDSSLSDLH